MALLFNTIIVPIFNLVFAVFGILNPSYRGGLISFALFLFVLSGYVLAQAYIAMSNNGRHNTLVVIHPVMMIFARIAPSLVITAHECTRSSRASPGKRTP